MVGQNFTMGWIGLCLTSVLSVQAAVAGDIHVNGYYRSNGTYVQPHYRSAPDGNFSNNWSTLGNINPYTGEAGHLVAPPASYGHGTGRTAAVISMPPSDRAQPIARPESRTVSAPQSAPAPATSIRTQNFEHYEVEAVQRTASRIRALGYDVDPARSSLSDLLDAESRIRTAKRLEDLGQSVDWRATSLLTMLDIESRIRAANRLRSLGSIVDWQQRTLMEMIDEESRINSSQRLARRGFSVDWRKYSLIDLLSLERNAADYRP